MFWLVLYSHKTLLSTYFNYKHFLPTASQPSMPPHQSSLTLAAPKRSSKPESRSSTCSPPTPREARSVCSEALESARLSSLWSWSTTSPRPMVVTPCSPEWEKGPVKVTICTTRWSTPVSSHWRTTHQRLVLLLSLFSYIFIMRALQPFSY